MERPIVIAGASLAGLRAAQAIRNAGHDGPVVMVGTEPHLPYTRPPLSKELLCGAQEAEGCALGGGDLDVEWRLGVAATGLDPARRGLTLADGEELRYERLLIATGARARPWPGDPVELDGLFMLRDVGDALALRAVLAQRPRLAVVGGGFIGCEVAASARKLGVDVTVIELAPQPMPALGEELGARCAELHRAHGVRLRLGVGVAGFEGAGRLEAIRLADGSRVEADVALIALGAVPNTEWLVDSGLELEPGVVCDATLRARGAEDVFCAGDAAAWPHPLAGGGLIRIEHWTNAAEQGAHAATNLVAEAAGEEQAPYETVPFVWSDQYQHRIQCLGHAAADDHVEVAVGSVDEHAFVALYERDGRLRAVAGLNRPRLVMPYRKLLLEGATWAQARDFAAEQRDKLAAS